MKRLMIAAFLLFMPLAAANAQDGEWQMSMEKDPMDDTVRTSLIANANGIVFTMLCGRMEGASNEVAMAAIRAPINSDDRKSISYRIRFNGGAVETRTVRYARRAGTQEPAVIMVDDRDFDFILNNAVESIALEINDSIYGRVVVEYPPIPAEADDIKASCIGREKKRF